MMTRTFKFKEGTVIVEASEWEKFYVKTGEIVSTGRFTACLIGGTAPGLKTMMVKVPGKKTDRIFRTEEAAFEGGRREAMKQGYHPPARPTPRRRKK